MAMRKCLNTRHKQADDTLNRLYQQLLSRLSKARQSKLREAQQAWILFRDKSADFEGSATEGGSMQPLIALSVLVAMTEERATQFQALLQNLDTR